MAEIMRDPVTLTLNDTDYVAFDENHTWMDVVQWVMKNRVDAEELHYLLGEALKTSE